jgi:integrase
MPKGQTACPYIFKRGSLFYFRFVFPDRLAKLIGQRELRLALRTGYRASAIRRAIQLSARLQDLATTTWPENSMDPTQLETLVRSYIARALEEREDWRSTHHQLSESEIANELLALEYLETDYREQLRQHDYTRIRGSARQLLNESGIDIPEDQPAFWRFCRNLLKAGAQIHHTEIRRTLGEYDDAPIQISAPTPAAPAPQVKLSSVIAQFTADHLQANRWQAKTRDDNAAMFRDFIEIVGDVSIDQLTKETIRQYRQAVRQLPPNRTKQVRYRELNIDQGYLANNPATGMQLPAEKRPQEARSAFTQAELQRIFLSEEFAATRCGTQRRTSYMFWLPILGLHTGARLEELAQLTVSDIKEVDGVCVIDINQDDGKRLKNNNAVRQVALHPTMLQLGFLDFVARRKDRLFPELGLRQGRRGMTASNWFARYLDRLQITGSDKVFHSFRHSLLDALKQARVDIDIAREIAGHENPTMTYGRYGKALNPQVQFKYLCKIDFGVDLLPLKTIWPNLMNAGGQP